MLDIIAYTSIFSTWTFRYGLAGSGYLVSVLFLTFPVFTFFIIETLI